jgi:murein DD-endopeptidase MepM/ murein hydrolase activator NlpD
MRNKSASTILMAEILLLLIILVPSAEAGTIYVPDNYPTVQEAVEVANINDIIIVRYGSSAEKANITKKLLTVQSEEEIKSTDIQTQNPVVLFTIPNEIKVSLMVGEWFWEPKTEFQIGEPVGLILRGECLRGGSQPAIAANTTFLISDTSGDIVWSRSVGPVGAGWWSEPGGGWGVGVRWGQVDNNGNPVAPGMYKAGIIFTEPALDFPEDFSGVIPLTVIDITMPPPQGWSEDIRLTDNHTASQHPSIAVDSDNNVHVIWTESHYDTDTEKYFSQLYYTKLDRNGTKLVEDIDLSGPPWSASLQSPKSIAIDSQNNVHIVWKAGYCVRDWWGFTDCYEGVFYTKLDANGNRLADKLLWSATYPTWSNEPHLHYPHIVVDSNDNLHVSLWEQAGSIRYLKLDNEGNILAQRKSITTGREPSISVDSQDNVFLAFFDASDVAIHLMKLDNEGNIVIDSTKVSNTLNRWEAQPRIAIDSTNNIHLVWQDTDADSTWQLYYMKLDNGVNAVVEDKVITNRSPISDWDWIEDLSATIDSSDNIHITWPDNRDGNLEIYYLKIDNSGNPLGGETRLTSHGGSSESPSIAVASDNKVCVTWFDNRHGLSDIYYKYQGNGETTPSPPTNLVQFKSDGLTGIPVGAVTNEPTVVFKANVSDPDGDRAKLQIELRRLDEYEGKFLNTYTQESELVDSGSQATVAAYGLINDDYHWQARTVDETGLSSDWVQFGNNDISQTDFTVATLLTPKFLTLPFKDPDIMAGWIFDDISPPYHYGIDFIKLGILPGHVNWQSFDVTAADKGTAIWSEGGEYGEFVLIQHDEKDSEDRHYYTLYGHLSSINLPNESHYDYDERGRWSDNQWNNLISCPVKAGEVIGISGETGAEGSGIHLHFEVQKKGYVQYKTDPYGLNEDRDSHYGEKAISINCGTDYLWTTDPPTSADRIIAKRHSPVELMVYDSNGRATGLQSGQVKNEIPFSTYSEDAVTIFFPLDSYYYEVVGISEGTYGLDITSVNEGNTTTFEANGIPTMPSAVHQYEVDWDALSLGEEGVTIVVDTDGDGEFEKTVTSDSELTPEEFNIDPIADAGVDHAVFVGTDCLAQVSLNGSDSNDPDGGELSYKWSLGGQEIAAGVNPTVELPLGVHTIELVVNDGIEDSEPDEVVITVLDNTPPELTVLVTPNVLWPPNHKMVQISSSKVVSDNCDDSPTVTLISIVMNEGEETNTFDPTFDYTLGDGHTIDDIEIIGGNIYLRAERSGTGTGRVYTLTYKAVDDSENETVQSATVTVPHEQP